MARSFSGSDSIKNSAVATTATNNFSIGGWFYFPLAPTSTAVLLYNGAGNASDGYGLVALSGQLEAFIPPSTFIGPAVLTAGRWLHVVLSVINTGTGNLYVNGLVAGTPQSTAPVTPSSASGGGFWYGVSFQANNGIYLADEFVSTVALTAGQIASLAKGERPNRVVPAGNLAIYWPVDGLQSPEPDLSGRSLNGSLTGSAFTPGPPNAPATWRMPQFLSAAAPPTPGPLTTFKPFIEAWS